MARRGRGAKGVKRNNYFTGKLLTAEDLQAEQDYHRKQRQRHNRTCHAAGVVEGLGVTCAGLQVRVAAGLALDCAGREIEVPQPAELSLASVKSASLYVLLAYAERGVDFVPVVDGIGETTTVASRIEETFDLSVGPRPRAHPRRGKGWRGCGTEHPMPLARLVRSRGRWRVDRAYRGPVGG